MQNDYKQFSEDTKIDFYNHYFDNTDYIVFRYDAGSIATRKIIRDHIHTKQGTVLEIGTGFSTLLEDLPNFTKYGIDISEKNIEHMQRHFARTGINATLCVADAESLPFESNFFDVIVTSHTLEHIKNDRQVLEECARVLKPGGELIIFVPGRIDGIATQEEWLRVGHYRMYNSTRFYELEEKLAGKLRLQTICFPHKIHNLVWNKLKHVFRWANYPIKKWILRDGKTYEARITYQKILLPCIVGLLDFLDRFTMHSEKNFLGSEFNVLARFEKPAPGNLSRTQHKTTNFSFHCFPYPRTSLCYTPNL